MNPQDANLCIAKSHLHHFQAFYTMFQHSRSYMYNVIAVPYMKGHHYHVQAQA